MIHAKVVEAAAKAYYEGRAGSAGLKVWEDITPAERLLAHERMNAALEAAVPHMMAAAWDEGYMAEGSARTDNPHGATHE